MMRLMLVETLATPGSSSRSAIEGKRCRHELDARGLLSNLRIVVERKVAGCRLPASVNLSIAFCATACIYRHLGVFGRAVFLCDARPRVQSFLL